MKPRSLSRLRPIGVVASNATPPVTPRSINFPDSSCAAVKAFSSASSANAVTAASARFSFAFCASTSAGVSCLPTVAVGVFSSRTSVLRLFGGDGDRRRRGRPERGEQREEDGERSA